MAGSIFVLYSERLCLGGGLRYGHYDYPLVGYHLLLGH